MKRAVLVMTVCALALGVGAAIADTSNPLANYTGKVPKAFLDQKGMTWTGAGHDERATGGPDDFGYVFRDSAEPDGPTFGWVDISGTGTQILLGDDATAGPLALGFSFDFYGASFTDLYVSSNGWVSFTSPVSSDFSNDCPFPLPGSTPANIIAPFWDDMDPGDLSDPIYWQAFAAGACPYAAYAGACFVVTYDDFTYYPGGDGVVAGTWQVILLDNDEIIMQYEDVVTTPGDSATIGIANADGSIGLTYACNTPNSLQDSLAIRYYVTTDVADLEVTKTASADPVPPNGLVTFSVTVLNNGALDATGVTVVDDLPDEVTYISDDCGGSGSPWTWNVGALNVDQSVTCNITVRVDECARITNSATATCDQDDPPANSTGSVTINQSVDVLNDGSFEAGTPNPFWNEASTNFGTPLCDEGSCGTGGGTSGPLTGDWWSWFGGATTNEVASVDQDVLLEGQPVLTFYLWAPVPGASTADGTFDVYVDATSIFSIQQGDPAYSSGYTMVEIDLTAFADGGTHNLRFEGIQNGPDVVTFNVDDISVLSCGQPVLDADLAITKTGANDGDNLTGTYTITVTNNGPGDVADATVSDPLPAGVNHLSNDCGAVVAGGVMSWNIGPMAVAAQVSCTMDVSILNIGDTLNVAAVSHTGNDPNPSNDNATALIPRVEIPAIPTLGTWGLLALVGLMAGVAFLVLRRRA